MADAYQAWLCDLDGTLYRPGGVKCAMAAELVLTGLADARAIRLFRKQHEALRAEYAKGRVDGAVDSPFELQLSRTASALGMDDGALRETVRRWMIQRPARWIRRFRRQALIDEIRAFREGGGKTAIVSDYPAREKLVALGIPELFDVVVASGEEPGPRALKPDPSGFLLAAERLGVAPEKCLVLGDRLDADGVAAARARMGFRLVGG